MKIYTKTGDKGMTRLASGQAVSKASDRVETYGALDYLNSWIGRIISQTRMNYPDISEQLQEIQQCLFDCQTDLANPTLSSSTWRIKAAPTANLESWIDSYTEKARPLTRFILPGGSLPASDCQVARTLARNAERQLVKLSWTAEINPDILIYLNRLSDYFFTLAREFNRREGNEDIFYENER
ncbi:MAG: cob(I)yrinic acid a,c-diamide adenosyltransferase [Streptococcaceae bacterium]|jgi:cob(I)alamin adenosyltransferase|nr:cob(I)yrinic acid a,c-diamide adenosyltransferase [Streptococcaceae bacterium]